MKCPFCSNDETKVSDSRIQTESNSVRRRRQCLECEKRFTTFESVDLTVQVKKRDGSFQEFNIDKLKQGLESACRHTRVSHDQILAIASDISMEIIKTGVRAIDTIDIGERVMAKLSDLDAVAYVRFACVYKRYKEKQDLIEALAGLVK